MRLESSWQRHLIGQSNPDLSSRKYETELLQLVETIDVKTLSLKNKLQLVVLVPIAALVYFALVDVLHNKDLHRQAKTAQENVLLIEALYPAFTELQVERGLSSAVAAAPGTPLKSHLPFQRKAVDDEVAQLKPILDHAISSEHAAVVQKYLERLRATLDGLQQVRSQMDRQQLEPENVVSEYNRITETFIGLSAELPVRPVIRRSMT